MVLDENLLESTRVPEEGHVLHQTQPSKIKMEFRKIVREQYLQAKETQPQEHILILIFGHGVFESKGIMIGSGTDNSKQFSQKMLKSELKGAPNAKVALLSTACYSGGWTCNPLFNISTMTAASASAESRSWAKSGSSGRACGSMFTTAMIDKFIQNSTTGRRVVDVRNEDDEEEELDEHQEQTYAAFCGSMYESVLKGIDRRGMEHKFTFGAQDDAWGMCWRERVGVPLEAFRSQWEKLQDWPKDQTLHPSDVINRDPKVTKEQEAEIESLKAADKNTSIWDPSKSFQIYEATGGLTKVQLGKREISGLYGGSDSALANVVSAHGRQYLTSYQGNNDTLRVRNKVSAYGTPMDILTSLGIASSILGEIEIFDLV